MSYSDLAISEKAKKFKIFTDIKVKLHKKLVFKRGQRKSVVNCI